MDVLPRSVLLPDGDPSFRWIPSDCVRLTWGEYEMMNAPISGFLIEQERTQQLIIGA